MKMSRRIVERTNEQMHKVREKIDADEFQFRYSDTNEKEIKCLFGLLYFRGFTTIQNNQRQNSGMTIFPQGGFTGL